MAQCPSHDDHTPSLSVSQGTEGALVHCFAGCETTTITSALGLSIAELYDDYGNSTPPIGGNGLADAAEARLRELMVPSLGNIRPSTNDLDAAASPSCTYEYQSADGAPVFRVVRSPAKQFRQQRWDADSETWVNGLSSVQRVLFRLPQVLAARDLGQPIWLVEGEKDVLALEAAGVTATTSPQGASSWGKVADHARAVLAGADVLVIADKDDAGREFARQVGTSLSDVVASLLVVEAAEGKDAFDHVAAGHRLDEFVPWPQQPITLSLPKGMTGADVLDQVAAVIRRFVVMPSEEALVAVVLFVAHTYAVEAADATPYLHVTSPERRSGKTQLLEVLAELVSNPLHASSASASAIYRGLVDDEGRRATLLLDEVDTVFHGRAASESSEALRNVLNAGNRRKSARVIRTNRNSGKNESFDCFGPKVLGGIGSMPDTVEDRSIRIPMRRALEHELAALWWASAREIEAACSEVRPLVGRWARDIEDEAATLRPERVSDLNPRAWDAWEPLVALARLAGGEWEERARKAASVLSADRDDDGSSRGLANRLLRDCYDAFGEDLRLATSELVARLKVLPESQWSFLDGSGLNADKLARLLKGYGPTPTQFRDSSGQKVRGYVRQEFVEPWARYAGIVVEPLPRPLPESPVQTVQAVHPPFAVDPQQGPVVDDRDPAAGSGIEAPHATPLGASNHVPAVPGVPGVPATPGTARHDLRGREPGRRGEKRFDDLNPLCRRLAEQLVEKVVNEGSDLDLSDADAIERVLGTDPGDRGAVRAAIAAVTAWLESQDGRVSGEGARSWT